MTRNACATRTGFTLMELLMVLGLLVVFAAFSWPMLRGPMENSRLRDAASQLRNELSRTRLAAMQTGREQVLCFMPGGSRYCVAVSEVDVDAATCACEEGAASVEAAAYEESQTGGQGGEELMPLSLQLPEGVTFVAEESLEPAAAAPAVEGGAASADEGIRIPFHPDGTCADATIRLANARGYEVTIELRGLTAMAMVGPLERVTEMP